MKIVFCGSGSFGLPAFNLIVSGRHEIVGVVTQPARPAGRGGGIRHTPIAQQAHQAGLNVLELEKINAPPSVETIRSLRPDVIVVADFGQLIRLAVRQLAPLGAFNLHGSLLPELRGAAPVNWAIIRGYSVTGVTTFSLVDAMDAGDIYLQAHTQIDPQETAAELRSRMAQIGAGVVCDTLAGLAGGTIQPRPQDHSKATEAPRLVKADGAIDWQADVTTIKNLIHGTWPWPGGHSLFCGAKHEAHVTIARARAIPQDETNLPGAGGHGGEPGTVGADLTVATGSGRLEILEIQPAGKRLMTWRDFVNGYRVNAGDKFKRTITE